MEPVKVSKKKSSGKKASARPVKKAAPDVFAPSSPSLRLYRRIAGVFVFLVAAVLALVLLVSTTKAMVHVIPQPQTVEAAFLVQVVPAAAIEGQVRGNVASGTYEQAKAFAVQGEEKKEVLAKASGIVHLVNETSHNQPLVATTRLLSSGGILFRLDKGVTVPANGSVDAVAHADQPGADGDIGPDRFTIPGLSTSLQIGIYATSSEPMSGGQRFVSVVTQEELDRAAQELQDDMFAQAKQQLQAQAGAWDGASFTSEVVQKMSDTVPGTESDQFIISLILDVTGVFYRREDVQKLAEGKLYEAITQGFAFASVPVEDMAVEIQKTDEQKGEAQLRVELTGTSVVSVTHPLLDKSTLVGASPDEVKDRLVQAGVARDVQVDIFPPWATRIPALKDHIDVVVEQP